MLPVFDQLVIEQPGRAAVAGLVRFPARARCSDARVLDPDTVIVADCEPEGFRVMIREWEDRGTAEGLAEAVHQLELERAAQPPVIEVTVTTSPDGIPRLELERAVAGKVREITGGDLPRRRVLTAARRARKQAAAQTALPAWPEASAWWPPADPGLAAAYVSEDDTPTVELPVYPTVFEMRVP